jgi:hypothetical protein
MMTVTVRDHLEHGLNFDTRTRNGVQIPDSYIPVYPGSLGCERPTIVTATISRAGYSLRITG